jgi:hypothetical protein
LSNGEHCFISDKNIVKKKFCLDYQGVWNPVGEWEYDVVIFRKKIIFSYLFIYSKYNKNFKIR